MRSRSWSRSLVLTIGMAGSLIFTMGCEQNPAPAALSPLQPTSMSTGTNAQALAKRSERGRSTQDKRVRRKLRPCLGTVAKLMDERGGRLEHCGHKMLVPPGALSERRLMSITILPTEKMDVGFTLPNLDFGADGWFNTPVTIVMSFEDAELDGIDPADLGISWFDEDTQEWVDLGGAIDFRKKTVTVEVWHFTQYSLSVR